jgi:hypothetical protein
MAGTLTVLEWTVSQVRLFAFEHFQNLTSVRCGAKKQTFSGRHQTDL